MWLHAKLLNAGLSSYLITDDLGANQTQLSQGIIHSGVKYTLNGRLSAASEQIKDMPKIWRQCLDGTGEIDLSKVEKFSDNQLIVSENKKASKFFQLLGSKALKSRVSKTTTEFPFNREMSTLKLSEPVLNPISLVEVLSSIGNVQSGKVVDLDINTGQIELASGHRLCGERIFLTAGSGVAKLISDKSLELQRRPLKMLHLSRKGLPKVFCHIIGASSKPLATITSNHDGWYIGGQLAENVKLSDQKIIENTQSLFNRIFDKIDLNDGELSIMNVDRIEPKTSFFMRPDGPFHKVLGKVCVGLPVKLAFAPLLAETLFQYASATSSSYQMNLPKPKISEPPWKK